MWRQLPVRDRPGREAGGERGSVRVGRSRLSPAWQAPIQSVHDEGRIALQVDRAEQCETPDPRFEMPAVVPEPVEGPNIKEKTCTNTAFHYSASYTYSSAWS